MKLTKYRGWRAERDEICNDDLHDSEVLYYHENPIKKASFWCCDDCEVYADTKEEALESCMCVDNPLYLEGEQK